MARSYVSFPQLVDIIGEADAVDLCRAHGGCALYITQTPERSALVGIISGCAIESLCAAYPGEELMLPLGPCRKVPVKVRIAAMLESGCSHIEVARECGCTARYVAMVKEDMGLSKPQRRKKRRQKPRTDAKRKA